ncbi:MAG: hypothetical protein ABEL51_06265 [Salinibacter sp.]
MIYTLAVQRMGSARQDAAPLDPLAADVDVGDPVPELSEAKHGHLGICSLDSIQDGRRCAHC